MSNCECGNAKGQFSKACDTCKNIDYRNRQHAAARQWGQNGLGGPVTLLLATPQEFIHRELGHRDQMRWECGNYYDGNERVDG